MKHIYSHFLSIMSNHLRIIECPQIFFVPPHAFSTTLCITIILSTDYIVDSHTHKSIYSLLILSHVMFFPSITFFSLTANDSHIPPNFLTRFLPQVFLRIRFLPSTVYPHPETGDHRKSIHYQTNWVVGEK